MLSDFITENRDEVVARVGRRVASRPQARPSGDLPNGIPLFLDQLVAVLIKAESVDSVDSSELEATAARYGGELFEKAFTVSQIVHNYGDVCQVTTQMVGERSIPIDPDEFRILNFCLDQAIAEAVTEFTKKREQHVEYESTEKLGVLAHEMRNLLTTSTMTFEMISSGQVAPGGSTAAAHKRSLSGLVTLVDRSLVEVRLDAGIERLEVIPVWDFIEEVEAATAVMAKRHNLSLDIAPRSYRETIEGDRQVLVAAMVNLLQNAFKFTPRGGNVRLNTESQPSWISFNVEDQCGGLPPGKVEKLFLPFEQHGSNRDGVGLGLSICQKAAKANHGDLVVRDLPGKGCIFTLALPKIVSA